MPSLFARLFGVALHARAHAPSDGEASVATVPVRYRPRLISELEEAHTTLRRAVCGILDACRGRDEDGSILTLQKFARSYRHACLTKSVQLYPYLRWALQSEPMAMIQLKAIDADVQRHILAIEALLDDYLGAPWLSERKRRLPADIARLAHLLAEALRMEESTVFPMYATPGQYRYLRTPPPDESGA